MAKIKKEKKDEVVETPIKEEVSEVDDSMIAIPGTPITQNMIKEYKAQFKKVYLTEYAGELFVWHRLNRKDFAEIYNATQDIDDLEKQTDEREKRFCLATILYPDNAEVEELIADDLNISPICDEILYKSGFVRPQTQEL